MAKPRFRLFAGPNASGKSHVFQKFKQEKYIHTEIYVNADRYERKMKTERVFWFRAYRIKATNEEFRQHILRSGLLAKVKDHAFIDQWEIRSGVLYIPEGIDLHSYHASFVASYLAEKLMQSKQSFAYETVMSHVSKVELLSKAHALGYKTYFYFIFVDDSQTNLIRMHLRVQEGGHAVPENTILKRIPETLALMPVAFEKADSAYVIDNSNQATVIFKKEKGIIFSKETFPSIIRLHLSKILDQYKGPLKHIS